MLKKILSLSFVLVNSIYASGSTDLGNFFDRIGFANNVTQSHSYQSQAAGFVSMGSIYARDQVRNIQLMHVDAPSIRAGCGGIDLTAGGFSFISSAEITKFMQSILSNGAGYALNLALETEAPEIAHAMQFMQKLAADINGNNLNSCEMAETASAMLWPKNRAAHQQICQDIAANSNAFSDWAAARQGCSTGGQIDNQLAIAKTNPEYKDRVLLNTNIVWEALSHNNFIAEDHELAEIYMSISGTIVFDKNAAIKTYPALSTNKDFIKSLLYGGKLPSYKCSEHKDCLNISMGEHTITQKMALVSQVQDLMKGIYNNILAGTALTLKQSGLIELTQPPVFQLISASAQQNIGIQSSYELAQNVATDLLAQYLANSLEIIRASLAGKDLGSANEDKLFKNIEIAQKVVDNFNTDSRSRFNAALQTNQLVQNNVKQALNTLTPMLRQAYVGAAP